MRHYIISAVTRNYAKMKKVWHCKRQNLPIPYARHEYSDGEVISCDEEYNIYWRNVVSMPMGIEIADNFVYVCTENHITIFDINTGQTIDEIHHPLFNDLHSIARDSLNPNCFLVTSSGSDRILLLNTAGQVTWQWSAIEHGFDRTSENRLKVEHNRWNDKLIPTKEQSTHVNYAIRADNGLITASLFHQGKIIEIMPNGDYRELLTELSKPHSVHSLNNNVYVCANSNAKEILFFCPSQILSRWVGQGWIQNLTITPEGIYYIDADWGDVGLLAHKEYQHVFVHSETPHSSLLIHHVIKRFPSCYRLFDIRGYDK